MKKSPHEHVYILLLSYLIGFVTAYIAFGISSNDDSNFKVVHYSPTQKSIVDKEINTPNANYSLKKDETGLYIVHNNESRILSANLANVINATDPELKNGGYHSEIHEAQISLDNKFVYFCEQISKSANDCNPFVFDVNNDTTHRVSVDGKQVQVGMSSANANWEDGLLRIGSVFKSSSKETPWK